MDPAALEAREDAAAAYCQQILDCNALNGPDAVPPFPSLADCVAAKIVEVSAHELETTHCVSLQAGDLQCRAEHGTCADGYWDMYADEWVSFPDGYQFYLREGAMDLCLVGDYFDLACRIPDPSYADLVDAYLPPGCVVTQAYPSGCDVYIDCGFGFEVYVHCVGGSCICDAGTLYDYGVSGQTPSEMCAEGARRCAIYGGATP